MAKAEQISESMQIAHDEGLVQRSNVVSPDDEPIAPPSVLDQPPQVPFPTYANDALQSEIEAQRAFDVEPETPVQPYVVGSSMYRNELIAKKAKLDSDIANLEGQRNGMNARIDDMNMERNAVEAGLSVLK